jgi:hypothetical protein
MATQTVLPAPADIGYESDPQPPAKPAATHRHSIRDLQPVLFALGFFAIAVTLLTFVHRFQNILFQLLFYALIVLASSAVKYIRTVHPALLPAVLEPTSPLGLRLQSIKTALACTVAAMFLAGVVMVSAASFSASCSCENHPILFIAWLSTLLSSAVGYVGVQAYLGLRAPHKAPPPPGSNYGNWPYMRRPVSEYKPFVSDHWGRARER